MSAHEDAVAALAGISGMLAEMSSALPAPRGRDGPDEALAASARAACAKMELLSAVVWGGSAAEAPRPPRPAAAAAPAAAPAASPTEHVTRWKQTAHAPQRVHVDVNRTLAAEAAARAERVLLKRRDAVLAPLLGGKLRACRALLLSCGIRTRDDVRAIDSAAELPAVMPRALRRLLSFASADMASATRLCTRKGASVCQFKAAARVAVLCFAVRRRRREAVAAEVLSFRGRGGQQYLASSIMSESIPRMLSTTVSVADMVPEAVQTTEGRSTEAASVADAFTATTTTSSTRTPSAHGVAGILAADERLRAEVRAALASVDPADVPADVVSAVTAVMEEEEAAAAAAQLRQRIADLDRLRARARQDRRRFGIECETTSSSGSATTATSPARSAGSPAFGHDLRSSSVRSSHPTSPRMLIAPSRQPSARGSSRALSSPRHLSPTSPRQSSRTGTVARPRAATPAALSPSSGRHLSASQRSPSGSERSGSGRRLSAGSQPRSGSGSDRSRSRSGSRSLSRSSTSTRSTRSTSRTPTTTTSGRRTVSGWSGDESAGAAFDRIFSRPFSPPRRPTQPWMESPLLPTDPGFLGPLRRFRVAPAVASDVSSVGASDRSSPREAPSCGSSSGGAPAPRRRRRWAVRRHAAARDLFDLWDDRRQPALAAGIWGEARAGSSGEASTRDGGDPKSSASGTGSTDEAMAATVPAAALTPPSPFVLPGGAVSPEDAGSPQVMQTPSETTARGDAWPAGSESSGSAAGLAHRRAALRLSPPQPLSQVAAEMAAPALTSTQHPSGSALRQLHECFAAGMLGKAEYSRLRSALLAEPPQSDPTPSADQTPSADRVPSGVGTPGGDPRPDAPHPSPSPCVAGVQRPAGPGLAFDAQRACSPQMPPTPAMPGSVESAGEDAEVELGGLSTAPHSPLRSAPGGDELLPDPRVSLMFAGGAGAARYGSSTATSPPPSKSGSSPSARAPSEPPDVTLLALAELTDRARSPVVDATAAVGAGVCVLAVAAVGGRFSLAVWEAAIEVDCFVAEQRSILDQLRAVYDLTADDACEEERPVVSPRRAKDSFRDLMSRVDVMGWDSLSSDRSAAAASRVSLSTEESGVTQWASRDRLREMAPVPGSRELIDGTDTSELSETDTDGTFTTDWSGTTDEGAGVW